MSDLRQREPRIKSTAWLAAVRSIGRCVLCGSMDAIQAAHRDEGKGMGMKTHDHMTACLCASCHRSLGEGKGYTQSERRALMDRAIVRTHDELVRAGLLRLSA